MSARDVIADIISDWSIRNGFKVDFGKCVNDYADEVITRLRAQGYAVVPKEMTDAMIDATVFAHINEVGGIVHVTKVAWRETLAAAKETK